MTWLGVWRFAFSFGSSLPIVVGGKNSHTGRTDFRGSGHERLKALEREVRELRRANEILKAASVFFAKELDPTRPR